MARTRFLLSLINFLVAGQCYCMAAAETNILTDQSSLLSLKSSITHDPENSLANWSNSTFVCNWTGVTCAHVHQNHLRVESLNLSHKGLVGTIPPHLGNLSLLVNLSARNNSFHGILPNELSRLSQLIYINFESNDLTGKIPSWLGSLSKLAKLFLQDNRFSGSIPASICNSTSLEKINLSENQISGSIPKNIGNLTLLKELDLYSNKIEGVLCLKTPGSILTTNKKPLGVAAPKCKVFDFPLQILVKIHPRVGDFALISFANTGKTS
ncbi:LRR domain containing protein [Trema orientale]|uniref:LRR domain containing protein n=1 Tax=Trema orientale TaxID=63057 RepID=A0A2P5AIU9_TREOI|nr:LRR domain containing protein [Trema orientale]